MALISRTGGKASERTWHVETCEVSTSWKLVVLKLEMAECRLTMAYSDPWTWHELMSSYQNQNANKKLSDVTKLTKYWGTHGTFTEGAKNDLFTFANKTGWCFWNSYVNYGWFIVRLVCIFYISLGDDPIFQRVDTNCSEWSPPTATAKVLGSFWIQIPLISSEF
jgi:hypothetical protein